MRSMYHVRGISMGGRGDVVQVDVRGDTLEIVGTKPGLAARTWLFRVPVVWIAGFKLRQQECSPSLALLRRLLGRGCGARADAGADDRWLLEVQVTRGRKQASLVLAGPRSTAEAMMRDLTAAKRKANPTFDVAL